MCRGNMKAAITKEREHRARMRQDSAAEHRAARPPQRKKPRPQTPASGIMESSRLSFGRSRLSGGEGHHPKVLPGQKTPHQVWKSQRRLLVSTSAAVAFGGVATGDPDTFQSEASLFSRERESD